MQEKKGGSGEDGIEESAGKVATSIEHMEEMLSSNRKEKNSINKRELKIEQERFKWERFKDLFVEGGEVSIEKQETAKLMIRQGFLLQMKVQERTKEEKRTIEKRNVLKKVLQLW